MTLSTDRLSSALKRSRNLLSLALGEMQLAAAGELLGQLKAAGAPDGDLLPLTASLDQLAASIRELHAQTVVCPGCTRRPAVHRTG